MDQKQKSKEKSKKWREENPEKYKEYFKRYRKTRREYMLKSKYGITIDQYNSILEKQGYRCALCFTHHSVFTRNLAVDHCHSTGSVRGILCSDCNRGIGLLQDSPEILLRAYKYTKGNKSNE